MRHVAIIGAGITGVTTAYALTDLGYAVTVYDRQPYAAMETSFANGGQLSASNAEVWNRWSTVYQGIRWMFRSDAPLLLNPKPSWHKYTWIAEFLLHIPRYRANTIATARLAIQARKHLLAIAEREGINFDLEKRGILHIYRNKSSFDHALEVNEMLVKAGLDRRPVTASEMRDIEPSLSEKYYGGFFTPSDSTGDIHKFTRRLAEASSRRGVHFVYNAAVQHIKHRGQGIEIIWQMPTAAKTESPSHNILNVDGVVVCAGIDSRRIAAQLGDRLNIYPVKGYSITVHLNGDASRAAAPWVSLLDDEVKIVTSRLGADRFRIAGTAELNGANRDIRADRIRMLLDWCREVFPDVYTDRVTPWCGLRPMLPDMMPRVGRGKLAGVFYNTGHGHLGWTLCAVTAHQVAQMVAAE